jgi:hypothetical protein
MGAVPWPQFTNSIFSAALNREKPCEEARVRSLPSHIES